jgi:hypothetical protein
MKKHLCLFAMLLISISLQAQTCGCNTTGWDATVVKINTKDQKVQCGYQFSLKCTDTIRLKGNYKCVGNCSVKYTAVLRNVTTGTIVHTYTPFTFPWMYQFSAAGNYTLEITPMCGEKKCQPCRYFFTVTCNTACDCNVDGWQPFKLTIGPRSQVVKCGYERGLKPGEKFTLDGKYLCKGNCAAKYTATIVNATGAVVQNFPSFTFPWTYSFSTPGNYKVIITPICGEKKCTPCTFYFTVR